MTESFEEFVSLRNLRNDVCIDRRIGYRIARTLSPSFSPLPRHSRKPYLRR